MIQNISSILCWISSHADWAAVIVTVVGLYFAYQQSDLWRKQLRANRKEEVATAISRLAKRIEVAFRHIRQQFPALKLEVRFKELQDAEPLFQDLIFANDDVQVHLPDNEVADAVEVILVARNDLSYAVVEQMKTSQSGEGGNGAGNNSVIAGNFQDGDNFGIKVLQACLTIRNKMSKARTFNDGKPS